MDSQNFQTNFCSSWLSSPSVKTHCSESALENLPKARPEIVEVSKRNFELIRDFIFETHVLATSTQYAQYIKQNQAYALPLKSAAGLFMGYDFHITEAGPKIIEINTNAGFPFGSALLYKHMGRNELFSDFLKLTLNDFRSLIPVDFDPKQDSIAIVDANPATQLYYPEFLWAADWLSQNSYPTEVLDLNQIACRESQIYSLKTNKKIKLIYNRHTDFMLKENLSAPLREAFLSDKTAISPNPSVYALLANKERLAEWSSTPDFFSAFLPNHDFSRIAACLPRSLNLEGSGITWSERKNWFFKPKESYGAKGVYAGAKLSTKKWEELLNSKNYLAQEFIPPAKIHVGRAPHTEELKYDLRAYAFNGEIRLLVARIFSGQAMNFQHPLSGFATTQIVS